MGVSKMKEHWVFVEGRQGTPLICSRNGIRIYYMDAKDDGAHLASRVPGLSISYDPLEDAFRIVRLNDKTGIQIEGA